MKPGPPPERLRLRILKGNPGQRKLHPEPQPAIQPTCPAPPAFIVGYAADEWWTVAPGLHQLGLLSVLDVASLSAYCYAYGQWRLAVEALKRMADHDQTMHGLLIKTTDGNAKRNPLVKIAADAADDMLRFAGEFGLTPVARSRLGAAGFATPSPPSKFSGLLSDGAVDTEAAR
jgi:P27 family predicted phage terminase small subunit